MPGCRVRTAAGVFTKADWNEGQGDKAMLVLSRKVGEKLVIGGNITVVVSRIAGNRVTLAIEAPKEVRIVRGELAPQEVPPQGEHVPSRVYAQEHVDARTASLPRLAK